MRRVAFLLLAVVEGLESAARALEEAAGAMLPDDEYPAYRSNGQIDIEVQVDAVSIDVERVLG